MKTKILAAMFGAMLMVSAIGGTAFAKHSTGAQGQGHVGDTPGQVMLCHNGHLIDVSVNSSHSAHRDQSFCLE